MVQPGGNNLFFARAANEEPKDMVMQCIGLQLEIVIGLIADGNRPFQRRHGPTPCHDYRLHALQGEIAEIEDRDRDALQDYTASLFNLPEICEASAK